MMRKLAIVLLAFCAACGPVEGDNADNHVVLGISAAAAPAGEALLQCAADLQGDPAIRIVQAAAEGDELDEYGFVIRLGEPAREDMFLAPLAEEQVVLALSTANPVDELTRSQVGQLLSGQLREWSEVGGEGGAVQLWVGFGNDEARRAIEEELLGGAKVRGDARIAVSADILVEVASNASAIGVLPAAMVDETVRQIDLGVSLPLLAVAAEEPSGPAREILGCLQGERGESLLSQNYSISQP